jgi:hypothetical protein
VLFFGSPRKNRRKPSEIPTAVCKSVRHGEKSVGARVLAPYEVAGWLFPSVIQIDSVSFYFWKLSCQLTFKSVSGVLGSGQPLKKGRYHEMKFMNFPSFCLQHEKFVDGIGELETRP